MKIRHYILLFSVSFILFSCAKKVDVTEMVPGIWETDWEDVLDGDLDEMSVSEIIAFDTDGTFKQVFSGEVKYDDWTSDTEVEYLVATKGTWKVVDKDNIVLRYDLNEFDVKVGKSGIEEDYTDAAIGLLTGNWAGFIAGAIRGSQTDKINQQVESEVNKQITKYFKEMFRKMNVDKEAFTDVKIASGTLTAEINHGFWGRDAVYDSKNDFKVKAPSTTPTDRKSSGTKKSSGNSKDSKKSSTSQVQSTSTSTSNNDQLIEFAGKIGKYPIKMYLDLKNINNYDRCEIVGKYRYTSSGAGTYLSLSGVKRGEDLELTERDEKGNRTGTFKGKFNIYGNLASFEYIGTFTNAKGKTFDFSLSSNY